MKPEIKEYRYLPSSFLPYLGNNYTIELRNLHSSPDFSSLNNIEKVGLNDDKLLY
jgi:hypothetical protein